MGEVESVWVESGNAAASNRSYLLREDRDEVVLVKANCPRTYVVIQFIGNKDGHHKENSVLKEGSR